MAVAIPILSVKNDANGDPPTFWCLPAWHGIVDYYDSKYRKVFFRTPCNDEEECSAAPETLRALIEAKLKQHPVWGATRPLLLDTYTVARNIQSEFGDGTPSERAAIGLAAVNRARAAGQSSITDALIHRERRTYGRQLGSIRPASTRQDPSLANLLLADMIVKGQIDDFTGGATHYLDRMVQDVMHRKNPDTPDGEAVYLDWTSGGDFLTWVGLIPNVRAWRLALMARRPDLRPRSDDSPALRADKISARAKIRTAGQKAILGKNRAPAPWDTCMEAVAALTTSAISGVDGLPEVSLLQDREGMATAMFCLAMSGIAGIAAASLGRPRRRRPLGSVDWLKYGDPERWAKIRGPVRMERTADAFDMGYGELKVLAKVGDTAVGELEAFTIPDSRHVTVDKIAVGPRGRGIGTALYEHAAHWACTKARKTLASDEKRSAAATGFWKKQVRKKRATCTWRLAGEEARSAREEESTAHPEAPIWARGGCVRYALKTCHAPISLAGTRGR